MADTLGFRYIFIGFSIFVSFFILHIVNATQSCSEAGYTVVTINGVFTDEAEAKENMITLSKYLGNSFNSEPINIDYLHNPSHLGGLGDIAKAVYQKVFDEGKVEDYDLVEMLKLASEKVRTQKLLLVAHSQGNFYANSFYDAVAGQNGGVPRESIGVYGVATPAGRVAGEGKWLTSDTDKVIADLVALTPFKKIMEPNTHIELREGDDSFGHSFSGVYLKHEGGRIISEIRESLDNLSVNGNRNEEGPCIDPPKITLAHKVVGAVFAVADPIANIGSDVIVGTAAIAYKANKFIAGASKIIGDGSGSALANAAKTIGNFISNLLRDESDANESGLVIEIDLEKERKESPELDSESEEQEEGAQLEIEDEIEEVVEAEPEEMEEEKEEEVEVEQPAEIIISECVFTTNQSASRGNLLINEIAWAGTLNSSNDEWIELKNISGSPLDISGWQLIDKSEQIKIKFKNGLKLEAGGFLFLERTDDDSVPGVSADLIYTGALSNSNEGLRLFDNQCNLVDEALAGSSWPAGDNGAKRTMERSPDRSWHTYSGNGEGNIFGTPKKENSPVPTPTVGSSPSTNSGGQSSGNLKILISEVQITGNTSKDEFVELYNPNDQAVDLTGWSVKRKSSSGNEYNLVAPSRLEGKSAPAKGYFLLAHETDYDGSVSPDVTWAPSNSISSDNTVLLYADYQSDSVDKVGFGSASDFETSPYGDSPASGQTLSRKSENDTDNNAADFALTSPSPKNSNTAGGFLAIQEAADFSDPANHLVISELFINMDGADVQEFVELYNPTNQSVNLDEWSLQYLSGSASTTDKIEKKNLTGGTVAPNSFYLIGVGGYGGSVVADIAWSQSLNNTGATVFLVSSTTAIDSFDDESIADKVAYGSKTDDGRLYAEGNSAAVPPEGQSLERRANSESSCLSVLSEGKFSGNSCDRDANSKDFEIQNSPNPQNSQNLPEPRTAPAVPQNFDAQYSSSTLSAFFSWNKSEDFSGATSTIKYLLSYATSSNQTYQDLTELTGTTTYQTNLKEVGVDYALVISAEDRDGLASATTSISRTISSRFSNFYFYKDTRASSTKYLLDFYYDNYPFVPDVYGNGDAWKILVFYLNQEAPDELELNVANNWEPESQSGVLDVVYGICAGGNSTRASLILPDTSARCGVGGGADNKALHWDNLEDLHLLVGLASTTDDVSFTVNDFVSVGIYSLYQSGGGDQKFKLAALDRNKYFFQDSAPVQQGPSQPANLELSFNSSNSLLRIIWDKSQDADTLDGLITYEINYSTTTLTEGGWGPIPNASQDPGEGSEIKGRPFTKISLEPNTAYNIGLRAKDDFGNLSGEAVTSFTTPDITPPYGMSDIGWGYANSSSTLEVSFTANAYPFMTADNASAIIFFLNQAPPVSHSFSNNANRWDIGGNNTVLKLSYSTCSSSSDSLLGGLLMHNSSSCPTGGSGLRKNNVRNDLTVGQTNFTVGISGVLVNGGTEAHTFTADDYITLGFYERQGNSFQEAATYSKKIYFTPTL